MSAALARLRAAVVQTVPARRMRSVLMAAIAVELALRIESGPAAPPAQASRRVLRVGQRLSDIQCCGGRAKHATKSTAEMGSDPNV